MRTILALVVVLVGGPGCSRGEADRERRDVASQAAPVAEVVLQQPAPRSEASPGPERLCQRSGCTRPTRELNDAYEAARFPKFRPEVVRFESVLPGSKARTEGIEVFGARARLEDGDDAGPSYLRSLAPVEGWNAWVVFRDGRLEQDHLELVATRSAQACVGTPEGAMFQAHFVLRDTPVGRFSEIAYVVVSQTAPPPPLRVRTNPPDQRIQAPTRHLLETTRRPIPEEVVQHLGCLFWPGEREPEYLCAIDPNAPRHIGTLEGREPFDKIPSSWTVRVLAGADCP